jgi:hypothetical protein
MGPPRAAPVVLGVEDDERPVGQLIPQVMRRADTRDASANDQDVEVPGLLDLLGALSGS